MKKVFMAMMAVAAIAFVGCKSNNPPTPPTPPQPEFFDLDSLIRQNLEYAKQEAESYSLVGAELENVVFIVDKPFNTAKVEDMVVDTVITTFELGAQKTLTILNYYMEGRWGYRSSVIGGVYIDNGFKPEDIVTTWYDAVRVIQENCPELSLRLASINRSVYPEIKDSLVYNFSPIDLVNARTGEYIKCVPTPPM